MIYNVATPGYSLAFPPPRRVLRRRRMHRRIEGRGYANEYAYQRFVGLGSVNAGQAVSMSAPVAGAATSALLAGTAIGAWAGPIGAGVGALVGIIGGLFAAHSARAAGAKNENEAVNAFLPAFDQALQTVFQQANAGLITANDAITGCQTILAQWWQNVKPYQSGPGRADKSNNGSACGSVNISSPCNGTGLKCDKSCTATCCVGCNDLLPTIAQAINVFQKGGGTVTACTVYGSKYGATQRNSYTLTYTAPAAGSVAGIANAVDSGSIAGIPVWLLGAGVIAYLALRK